MPYAVIPAKAGIQLNQTARVADKTEISSRYAGNALSIWIPAFAG
jgi:hypothetical protein